MIWMMLLIVLVGTTAPIPAQALGLLTACGEYVRTGGANSIAGALCALYVAVEYIWYDPWFI